MSRSELELVWPGKYDATGARASVPRRNPALVTDCVLPPPQTPAPQLGLYGRAEGEAETPPAPDRLIVADNLLALDALLYAEPGSIDLIVADPPFATGGRFDVVTRVGEGDAMQEIRNPAYSDRWQGGAAGLIAMLAPRLRLCHALLAPHGSLYVHVDPTVGHAVKLLLDEIFGAGCFQREIVWRIGWVSGFKTKARNWIRNHDLIFFYVKDPKQFTFNKSYMPYPPGYTRRDGSPPKGRGVPLDDVWNANDVEHALRGPESLDSIQIKSYSREKTGYATQKNESVLRRIIEASSNPGDTVLDPFCGSGTTLAVARALGRRWVGIDTSRAAAQICLRRLVETPGPPIAVQQVHAAERSDLRARGHDWASFAEAEPETPAVKRPGVLALGVRAARTVWIHDAVEAGPDALEDRSEPAEVLAWAWRLPVAIPADAPDVVTGVPEAFGGPTAAIHIDRDVLGPAPGPRQGLMPLACPRVRIGRSATGGIRVSVQGLAEGWPQWHEPAPPNAEGVAMIDGWAVDVSGEAVPQFGFASFRHHHRRTLVSSLELTVPRAPLRIRVWDVLNRTMDLVVAVAADAGPHVRLSSAELQVGTAARSGGTAPIG